MKQLPQIIFDRFRGGIGLFSLSELLSWVTQRKVLKWGFSLELPLGQIAVVLWGWGVGEPSGLL